MEQMATDTCTKPRKPLFNMESHPIAAVELQLSQWARWVRIERDYGMGFPRETRESRLMREGLCVRESYHTDVLDDPDAEKTEAAIRQMPAHLQKVVEQYYLRSGTVEQKARELKMSRVTFHEHLRMAKYWLLGKWS